MASTTVHAHPQPLQDRGEWVRLSARVEGLNEGPGTLWYELEPRHADRVPDVADPLVLGLLFPAMEARRPLHVHGPVSRTLLRNLDEFQALWSSFLPERYSPVEITADREVDPTPSPGSRPAIAAFSGGLDSAFTVQRHASGALGRRTRDLAAGVMILGFDIRLDQEDHFAGAADGARAMLDSLGLDLWRLRTNFRDFKARWFIAHGAGLASCLHCYAGGCSSALVASSNYHTGIRQVGGGARTPPAGSHLLTDHLLGSPLMEIVHDGAEVGRLEKARMVADWPEGMAHLRVCWETDTPDSNCGTCTKCILTKLAFMASGLRLPDTLATPPTAREIAALRLGPSYEMTFTRSLLEAAEANGLSNEPFAEALRGARRRARLRSVLARFGLRN